MKIASIAVFFFFCVAFMVSASAAQEAVYILFMESDGESLSFKNLDLMAVYYFDKEESSEGYRAELIDEEGFALERKFFDFFVYDEGDDFDGEFEVIVYLPYDDRGEKINVYSPEDKLLFTADVQDKSVSYASEESNIIEIAKKPKFLVSFFIMLLILVVLFVIIKKRVGKSHSS